MMIFRFLLAYERKHKQIEQLKEPLISIRQALRTCPFVHLPKRKKGIKTDVVVT